MGGQRQASAGLPEITPCIRFPKCSVGAPITARPAGQNVDQRKLHAMILPKTGHFLLVLFRAVCMNC